MAEKAYYVTEEGREALEKELDYLKVVRRKEVAEKNQGGALLRRPFRKQ